MGVDLPSAGTRTSFQINDERWELLDEIDQALEKHNVEENTWAKIVDRALRHYLESIENLEQIKGQVTPEQARAISTSELRVQQQSYVAIPS